MNNDTGIESIAHEWPFSFEYQEGKVWVRKIQHDNGAAWHTVHLSIFGGQGMWLDSEWARDLALLLLLAAQKVDQADHVDLDSMLDGNDGSRP
jgi:hypothetical protein